MYVLDIISKVELQSTGKTHSHYASQGEKTFCEFSLFHFFSLLMRRDHVKFFPTCEVSMITDSTLFPQTS
eukprot:UN10980